MRATPFSIEPLTPSIGAEISGLDLRKSLDEATLDALYGALLDHLVLFFRDQSLPPAAHLAFAETFGEIDRPHPVYPHAEGHPNVVLLENGPDRKPDTNEWHTDLTYYENPPFASILHALEVPACGGDTLWASMYAAYEALPAEIKSHLEGREAIHDMGDFRNDFLAGGGVPALDEAMARTGSAVHPLVPRHPVTGRPHLYVSQPFTRLVVGMNARESDRLLRYLFDHIERPEFQVRFRWRPGALAIWDNRVTQHYAVNDYLPQRRRMHRVTVVSDRRAREGWTPAGRLERSA
jgi:taurine dioxygenase